MLQDTSCSQGTDFTHRAQQQFSSVTEDPYFESKDTQMIYDLLQEQMQTVPFGAFLKRFLYQKAGMTEPFSTVQTELFVDIVCKEFESRSTPCSFTPTSARLRNTARRWLEQTSVARKVVLILGFGLGMSTDEVDRFLTKALQEPSLNAKDPLEVICWHCYRNCLRFEEFEALWKRYEKGRNEQEYYPQEDGEKTVAYKQRFLESVSSERELFEYLAHLPIYHGSTRQSVSARITFDQLYQEARGHVARIMTEIARDTAQIKAGQRMRSARQTKENYTVYQAEDVSPGDFESVLYAAVPRDKNGNMLPVNKSTLNAQFAGHRLNRQHIFEVLDGNTPITRFDLITLSFFNYSQREDMEPRQLYSAFIEKTNADLHACGMGPLYIANPYECFLLMCMLSDDPLGTFADVWECSYDDDETEENPD